jgi:hypothetical protein
VSRLDRFKDAQDRPHARQWVFAVPVRYQLAFDAGLTRAVLRVFLRTVFGWQRRRDGGRGLVRARST